MSRGIFLGIPIKNTYQNIKIKMYAVIKKIKTTIYIV